VIDPLAGPLPAVPSGGCTVAWNALRSAWRGICGWVGGGGQSKEERNKQTQGNERNTKGKKEETMKDRNKEEKIEKNEQKVTKNSLSTYLITRTFSFRL
jgi:hypothetical protein